MGRRLRLHLSASNPRISDLQIEQGKAMNETRTGAKKGMSTGHVSVDVRISRGALDTEEPIMPTAATFGFDTAPDSSKSGHLRFAGPNRKYGLMVLWQ
jgi:hypothetical protein